MREIKIKVTSVLASFLPMVMLIAASTFGSSYSLPKYQTIKVSEQLSSITSPHGLPNERLPAAIVNFPPTSVSKNLVVSSDENLLQNGGGYAVIEKTNANDQIKFGSIKILNNLWGAPAEEKLFSSIFLNDTGVYGWEWSRLQPSLKTGQQFVQPIYPSIRIGGNPWEASNIPSFPVKVGDITNLNLKLSYEYLNVKGTYDLAYDIFLMDTDKPSSNPKRSAEIMICLGTTITQRANSYKGDYSDGSNTFQLYSWVMSDGRVYYSFVQKSPHKSGTSSVVDAKALFDQLKLNPDWYIHGIELGSEIVQGSGKIQINGFNINLNGLQI